MRKTVREIHNPDRLKKKKNVLTGFKNGRFLWFSFLLCCVVLLYFVVLQAMSKSLNQFATVSLSAYPSLPQQGGTAGMSLY